MRSALGRQITEHYGNHLFAPIAEKRMESGTHDDDTQMTDDCQS